MKDRQGRRRRRRTGNPEGNPNLRKYDYDNFNYCFKCGDDTKYPKVLQLRICLRCGSRLRMKPRFVYNRYIKIKHPSKTEEQLRPRIS